MRTIAENLQIIKDSTEAIKQAIIDKGGTISGDITTYAEAIEALVLGESLPTEVVLSAGPNENNAKVYTYLKSFTNVESFTDLSSTSDTILVNVNGVFNDLYSDGRYISRNDNFQGQ